MLHLGSPAADKRSQLGRHGNASVAMIAIAGAEGFPHGLVRLWIAHRQRSTVVRLAQLPGVGHTPAAVDAAGEVDLTTERPARHDVTEPNPPLVMPVAPPTGDGVTGATVDAARLSWHVCTSDIDDADAVRRSGPRKTAVVDERVRRFDELAPQPFAEPRRGPPAGGGRGGGAGGEAVPAPPSGGPRRTPRP